MKKYHCLLLFLAISIGVIYAEEPREVLGGYGGWTPPNCFCQYSSHETCSGPFDCPYPQVVDVGNCEEYRSYTHTVSAPFTITSYGVRIAVVAGCFNQGSTLLYSYCDCKCYEDHVDANGNCLSLEPSEEDNLFIATIQCDSSAEYNMKEGCGNTCCSTGNFVTNFEGVYVSGPTAALDTSDGEITCTIHAKGTTFTIDYSELYYYGPAEYDKESGDNQEGCNLAYLKEPLRLKVRRIDPDLPWNRARVSFEFIQKPHRAAGFCLSSTPPDANTCLSEVSQLDVDPQPDTSTEDPNDAWVNVWVKLGDKEGDYKIQFTSIREIRPAVDNLFTATAIGESKIDIENITVSQSVDLNEYHVNSLERGVPDKTIFYTKIDPNDGIVEGFEGGPMPIVDGVNSAFSLHVKLHDLYDCVNWDRIRTEWEYGNGKDKITGTFDGREGDIVNLPTRAKIGIKTVPLKFSINHLDLPTSHQTVAKRTLSKLDVYTIYSEDVQVSNIRPWTSLKVLDLAFDYLKIKHGQGKELTSGQIRDGIAEKIYEDPYHHYDPNTTNYIAVGEHGCDDFNSFSIGRYFIDLETDDEGAITLCSGWAMLWTTLVRSLGVNDAEMVSFWHDGLLSKTFSTNPLLPMKESEWKSYLFKYHQTGESIVTSGKSIIWDPTFKLNKDDPYLALGTPYDEKYVGNLTSDSLNNKQSCSLNVIEY